MGIATGDELLGVGAAVPLGSFRLMARSMITAPDLRTMLIRMEQASRVLTTLPHLEAVLGETRGLTVDVSHRNYPPSSIACVRRPMRPRSASIRRQQRLAAPLACAERQAAGAVVDGEHVQFKVVAVSRTRCRRTPLAAGRGCSRGGR